MEFFLKDLKQSVNDTEYDGIEMFNKIVKMCQLGPSVDLDIVRKGYYLFWLNDFCYTGWGYKGREVIKAYILTETLPTSILHEFTNYKWVVIRKVNGQITHHELILPTDENDNEHVNALTRFFLAQNSLAYNFYENVGKLADVRVYDRKSTYKGHSVTSVKDMIDVHKQQLEISNFAVKMIKRGTSSYGCMQRSNKYRQLVVRANAKISLVLETNWLGAMTYETDEGLSAYIIRELVKFKEVENWKQCKVIMELIVGNFTFSDKQTVTVPDEINAETVNKFKDDVFGGGSFMDIPFFN